MLNICVHSVTAGFHIAGVAKVKKGITYEVVVLFPDTTGTTVELKTVVSDLLLGNGVAEE